MHEPHVFTPASALKEYVVFHRSIASARQGFVLARFETVTSDFGGVIDAINAKFSTNFERFEHTEANVKYAFEQLDRLSQERGTAPETGEPYVPGRPQVQLALRERQKAQLREQFQRLDRKGATLIACRLYDELRSIADI